MIDSRTTLIRKYIKSLISSPLYKKDFEKVETFCLFIGYPRSGHSFLGALLDAHPEIIIAMEEDALYLVKYNFSKNQLFYCLLQNSKNFTQILNNIWTGYSYAVPNSNQGNYTKLRVIGDKKGGRSAILLGKESSLFDQLKNTVNCGIKIFHVIRNPFDDISTMVKRNMSRHPGQIEQLHKKKIELYFEKVYFNNKHRENPNLNILDVYHEDFISAPKLELKRMIEFLGLTADNSYYQSCASITYKSPHKSRFELEWPENLKKTVLDKMSEYKFLKRYSFEN